jgi:hypothetical protein
VKDVVIVIAPIIIRELNKHKDFPKSPKIRDRARDALKSLDSWSEQTAPIWIRDSVELQFRVRDPLIDYASNNLSRDISDDQLIASMIEHRNEHPDCALNIVTADLGLKLKAKAHDLSAVRLPADLKLTDEPLEAEKKIRELQSELMRLQSRIPALKLAFTTGDNLLKVKLKSKAMLTPGNVSHSINVLRDKYPEIVDSQRNENPGSSSALASLAAALSWGSRISAEDAERYNKSLGEFFSAYEKYLFALNDFQCELALTVKLEIMLRNDGTCPAEDIDIFMHFPNGFSLLAEHELPKEPTAPKPPTRPRTMAEQIADPGFGRTFLGSYNLAPRIPDYKLPTQRNVSHPSIRRTNSYDVNIGITRAKHGLLEPLEPMYLVFDSFQDAVPFKIEYSIYAENLPEPVTGELHVVVEYSGT